MISHKTQSIQTVLFKQKVVRVVGKSANLNLRNLSSMPCGQDLRIFQVRHDKEEKANPKLTAYQIELAQVETEIEKLLDTLTGANATLLAYANKKIEELDTRRQTISKAIAELPVETMSPQKEQELSYSFLTTGTALNLMTKGKPLTA